METRGHDQPKGTVTLQGGHIRDDSISGLIVYAVHIALDKAGWSPSYRVLHIFSNDVDVNSYFLSTDFVLVSVHITWLISLHSPNNSGT